MNDITTTDLSDFGSREYKLLCVLIDAMEDQGLPEDFEPNEVHPMFNKDSGHVFLTNSEFQACMMNGDKLETWYHCGNCGHEGFAEDCKLNDEGCECCKTDEVENEN